MQTLEYRQTKIQEKRKQTSFREFVREIASRRPFNIYKVNGLLSRFPDTPRKGNTENNPYLSMESDDKGSYTGNFFQDFQTFYTQSHKSTLVFAYQNENAEFTDSSAGTKNCYLGFKLCLGIENGLYSLCCRGNCDNIVNSASVFYNSSIIFESKNIRTSSFIFYSCNIDNSSDLRFCSNMVGCHNCIDCDTLMNQSYCINNIQLSKEDYQIKKAELLRDTSTFPAKKLEVFKKMRNIGSSSSIGTGLINSENVENGYLVIDTQDSRNIVEVSWGTTFGITFESSNVYDGLITSDTTNSYGVLDSGRCDHLYNCIFCGDSSSHLFYCMNVHASSFCLGCIGMTNKQYCIFNQQYTKEERYAKVDEIFTELEKSWTLWAFFPATMNPFYFNDTAAYLLDPTFTKEEVEAAWYLRRDEPIKVDIPANAELVKTSELNNYEGFNSEGKRTINEEILKKVIVDESWNMWRIVNKEYAFLVKYGLPLSRKHRLDRMKENFRVM